MNKSIEICLRNELWGLIKKVSANYGGDDIDWLKEYARDMLKNNTLQAAVKCFREIASYRHLPHRLEVSAEKNKIKYQSPFI